MAWIAKNSGTMQIERQDEPYLDEVMKAELEAEVIPRYPTRQAATLPVLHAVQNKHNWLPYQALEEVAEFLELTAAQVLDTASFYDQFYTQPKGRHLIMLCQSLTCEIVGQPALRDALCGKLGIEPGQTTDDGRFTLVNAECLGACDGGPCALVNEQLHEKLTLENFEAILDTLQ